MDNKENTTKTELLENIMEENLLDYNSELENNYELDELACINHKINNRAKFNKRKKSKNIQIRKNFKTYTSYNRINKQVNQLIKDNNQIQTNKPTHYSISIINDDNQYYFKVILLDNDYRKVGYIYSKYMYNLSKQQLIEMSHKFYNKLDINFQNKAYLHDVLYDLNKFDNYLSENLWNLDLKIFTLNEKNLYRSLSSLPLYYEDFLELERKIKEYEYSPNFYNHRTYLNKSVLYLKNLLGNKKINKEIDSLYKEIITGNDFNNFYDKIDNLNLRSIINHEIKKLDKYNKLNDYIDEYEIPEDSKYFNNILFTDNYKKIDNQIDRIENLINKAEREYIYVY